MLSNDVINVDNIKRAVLPIFYLKYIDDKKSTDNLIVQLELTVDLILLISSAGSFDGLELLKNINRLGRVVLGLEVAAPTDIIITFNLAIEGGKLMDITGNLAKIFLDYFSNYEDTYSNVNSSKYDKDKCDFYSKLDSFFTVLQVLTTVTDFVTSRLLKKASQRLILDAPEDLNPEIKSLLQKFAGDLADATETFRLRVVELCGDDSVIWTKFHSLEELKQEQFLEDFGSAEKETLDALNSNNGELIQNWDDAEFILDKRRDINFLKTIDHMVKSDELNEEIFVGQINKVPTGDQPDQFAFPSKGVHHKNALKANELGGKARIKGEIIDVGPEGAGYYQAKVELFHEDFTTNDGFKVKKLPSTFFPDAWTRAHVQVELAFAFKNKIYLGGNLY